MVLELSLLPLAFSPSLTIASRLLSKRLGCLSGFLVSSASIVVLWKFLNLQWSFDEFMGENIVSLSYFSAILGLPYLLSFL